jgi:hypothetical protein
VCTTDIESFAGPNHNELLQLCLLSIQTGISLPGRQQNVGKVFLGRHNNVLRIDKVFANPFRRIHGLFHKSASYFCKPIVANVNLFPVDALLFLAGMVSPWLDPDKRCDWFSQSKELL